MTRRGGRLWLLAGLLVALVAAAAAAPRLYSTAVMGSGFMAQMLCADVFVSKREPDAVLADDMTGPGYGLLWFFQPAVDRERQRVTASAFGVGRQSSIFREGLGCTLVAGTSEAALRAEAAGVFQRAPLRDDAKLWPEGEFVALDTLPETVDRRALEAGVTAAFAEPDPAHPRRTRALVVVHGGRIVAERYAEGFDAAMPLMGWSMSKMALNALVGLRVQDGKLGLADKALLPEWRGPADPRRDITLDELLRMTSGLVFDETYGDLSSDVMQMLFVKGDKAGFAAAKPLAYPPGRHWSYASGTSSLIARILRQSFAEERDYLSFPHDRLFAPLAMHSAVLEPDAEGTFVASSFMYASARDWARLGLFFLRDGVWQGRRLLPEGWAAYSLTPTVTAPDAQYGAHVWLKLPQSPNLGEPPMPQDAYYMLGHDQQIVAVVPSRDLVIVRLGLTRAGGDWEHARDLAPIVAAFPQQN